MQEGQWARRCSSSPFTRAQQSRPGKEGLHSDYPVLAGSRDPLVWIPSKPELTVGLQKGARGNGPVFLHGCTSSSFIPLDPRKRGCVSPHGLKLEVVFPSPELTLQEMKLKTGDKVHYGGHWEMPDPTDLVPTVAERRASLRAGAAAAGTTQPSAEPWAHSPDLQGSEY